MGVTRPDSSARIKGEVVQPVSPGDDRRGAVWTRRLAGPAGGAGGGSLGPSGEELLAVRGARSLVATGVVGA